MDKKIIIIILLVVMLGLFLIAPLKLEKLEEEIEEPNKGNLSEESEKESIEGGVEGGSNYKNGGSTLDCLVELKLDYTVNNKKTESTTDDEVSLIITNKLDKKFEVDLFINGEFEKKVLLKEVSKFVMKSEILTNWWVSLSEPIEQEFQITFRIAGCEDIKRNLIITYPEEIEED